MFMSWRSNCPPLHAGRAIKRDNAVPSSTFAVVSGPRSAARNSTTGAPAAQPLESLVNTAATIGAIAAGVALLDLALIPGMVIGGAAVLAPNLLPKLGRRLRPMLRATLQQRTRPNVAVPVAAPGTALVAVPNRFTVRQAIAKTITFRVIVTSLDFTVNYVVLGEFAAAAGLSAFALVVGPLFYLAHETVWNRFGDADKRVDLTIFLRRSDAEAQPGSRRALTISRALAKTITFRTIATTMDFTVNFVVVADLATAAALSASGFILGPFVYFGHEWVWDRYGSPAEATAEFEAPLELLPAPG
jgi:uncharacterized membrane protein